MKKPKQDILTELWENPNEALVFMYKHYRSEFLSWSNKNYGIPEADALDCFQDAVIVFYRNVVEGKITELTSSEKSYLFGIGKNFILRKKKKIRQDVANDTPGNAQENYFGADMYSGGMMANRVADLVLSMRDPCKSILRYFYFRGLNMEEIALKMDYKNAQTVKAQKVRCIKEIKSLVKRKLRSEL